MSERPLCDTGDAAATAYEVADGLEIVYVARVAVPKLIALVVRIGTKFPAVPTSGARCCSLG